MPDQQRDVVSYLSGFVTPERLQTMDRVIRNRTRYITIALEDIYQSHNASAVLRTCECFGIQDVHIIENKNRYTVNPDVALGATKWLNLTKYNKEDFNTPEALRTLKSNGYRIVATTLSDEAVALEDFDLGKGKLAIFFGTELTGLTPQMIKEADEHLKIPLFGFTESFNISVSAAIIMHHLTYKLKESGILWQLSPEEMLWLKYNWLMNSIKRADLLEKKFLEDQNKGG
jgi:tRNA (guanosine-2'-O-)-methyltransferase